MERLAIITGVGGQDGAYLSKNLLEKGYKIIGLSRRSSVNNLSRLEILGILDEVEIISADVQEHVLLQQLIQKYQPDEFYNLAAQSYVVDSFSNPYYTSKVNAFAVLNILESLKIYSKETRFYQASTSEMFGKVLKTPQNEETGFYPRSPYGFSKLYAHHATINYRESYDLFACSGILFNHESPLRGGNFVTKKIVNGLVNYKNDQERILKLGNLDAQRDWGFAGDYVEAMRLMLSLNKPEDFVVSSGRTNSIREFCEIVAKLLEINLVWEGTGMEEQGIDSKRNKPCIKVDEVNFRPAEVDLLQGDSSKAKEILGWFPTVDLEGLAKLMVDYELQKFQE